MCNKNIQNEKIKSFCGLKVIALLGIFYWHLDIPKIDMDLGARLCEFFFVISGFLVAYNFLNKNVEANFSNSIFYFKKKLRQIYPLHLTTLIIALIFLEEFNLTKIYLNLLLLHPFALDKEVYFGYNGLSWFIADLVFCYLFAPLLMYFVRFKNFKTILKFLFAIILSRILIELIPTTTHYTLWEINYYINPLVRLPEFFTGMLLVPVFNKIKEFSIKSTLFNFLEIFYCTALYIIWLKTSFLSGFYIPFISFLILIFAFDKGIISRLLSNKIFLTFGTFGLEFYMIHHITIRMFNTYYPNIFNNIFLSNTFIFILICLISYICYVIRRKASHNF